MEENLILRKAELTLGGGIRLPAGFTMPVRVSHSTAGPGAGFGSAVFAFGGMRVKKSISYDEGEFELNILDNNYSITRNGEPFLDNVTIQPVVYHSPEQAFFNLDQRCMFNCAFCSSPKLDSDTYKGQTPEIIVEKITEAVKSQKVVSVSLTSGVLKSVCETVNSFVICVKKIREAFPDMPIGVEPYVSERAHIVALKEAGANEIKINLESASDRIFQLTCPDLDRDSIKQCLKDAVDIFGRGKVSSNIMYGMGETDEEILNLIEELCRIGVVPTLRALRLNSFNQARMTELLGDLPEPSAERSIFLAKESKRIMEENGLSTIGCKTMCLECGCCDLVPFRDL